MCHPREQLPGLLQPVTAALAAFSRSIHPTRLLLRSPGSRGPVWPCVPAGHLKIGEGSSIEAAGCGGGRSLGWGERQPCPITALGTFRGVAASGAGSSWVSCSLLVVGTLVGRVAGQGRGALSQGPATEPLGELAPVLTVLCSLLDGPFHKHVICKVSVPSSAVPPVPVPSESPAGAAWGCGARWPRAVWGGRAELRPTPGCPWLLGRGGTSVGCG